MKLEKKAILLILTTLLIYLTPIQVSYAQVLSPDKPTNIIIVIADGMGLSHITAAMIQNGDSLNLLRIKHIGFIKTNTTSNIIPDLASLSTGIATGVKTNKGFIGLDINKKETLSILDIAKQQGMQTGIITTGSVTHPSVSAFYAHSTSEANGESIARDLAGADLDIFIGGGKDYFSGGAGEKDLIFELRQKSYKIIETYKELYKKPKGKFIALLEKDNLKSNLEGRRDYLSNAWQATFRAMMRNKAGYFIIVNNAHTGWGSRKQDLKMVTSEILELDNLISEILDCIVPDKKTLLLFICNGEAGGLTVTGSNIKEKKVNVKWSSNDYTPSLTPVYAIGPGSENFTGTYDNTEIFQKLKSLLK